MSLTAGFASRRETYGQALRNRISGYPPALRDYAAVDQCEAIAAQFKAGDFDWGLMHEFECLIDNPTRRDGAAAAAERVLGRLGDDSDEFSVDTATDFLDAILAEAGRP